MYGWDCNVSVALYIMYACLVTGHLVVQAIYIHFISPIHGSENTQTDTCIHTYTST